MCLVMCLNSQWRIILIGLLSLVIAIGLALATAKHRQTIEAILEDKLVEDKCLSKTKTELSVSWNIENSSCVLLTFWTLFPWPFWTLLAVYSTMNVTLILAAVNSLPWLLVVFLISDSFFLALMSFSVCMSLFTSGSVRIILLALFFPIFGLSLCSWLSVYGYKLKLEARLSRNRKRREIGRALQLEIRKRKQKRQLEGFTNFGFI